MKHSTTEGRHDGIGIPSATRSFAVVKKTTNSERTNTMKRMQFIANLAATIALLASTAVLDAEPILYSTTGGGSTLVRIDVGAGTVTTIGDFGVPGAFALARSPHGKFYTVTQGSPGGDPQLASVDL